jgi:hypothetical protein
MSVKINVRLSGRKFQDPNVHTELSSVVSQVNQHLENVSSQIVQRKYGVIPVGLVDGSNKNFSLKESFNPTSLVVWLGPTKQVSSSYKIQSRTIVFTVAPVAGVIECDYDPLNGK